MKIQLKDGTVIERCRGNRYHVGTGLDGTMFIADIDKVCRELFKELHRLQNKAVTK